MSLSSYDIIIVGGSVVGATLALILARQTTFKVAILERNNNEIIWQPDQYHHRVSAITLSSKRIFEKIGIWQKLMAKRISPFTQIEVQDATTQSEIKFDCQEIAESSLGFIVENNLTLMVLKEALQQYQSVDYIAPLHLEKLLKNKDEIILINKDGHHYQAKIVIAADGANSWLCQQIPIKQCRENYQQSAIVATVATEITHQKCARQIFLPSGPLAFLPLADAHLSSIVWSMPTLEAENLMQLDSSSFLSKLQSAFSDKLGQLIKVSGRFTFPLYKQEAANYIAPRFALVGDAAHAVHPLAGQGVNMGLLDAASLAEVLTEAHDLDRDLASFSFLRRYERWRKADNFILQKSIHLLEKLFIEEKKSIQTLRSAGLSLLNQSTWLKNKIIREACGNRRGLPQLAS